MDKVSRTSSSLKALISVVIVWPTSLITGGTRLQNRTYRVDVAVQTICLQVLAGLRAQSREADIGACPDKANKNISFSLAGACDHLHAVDVKKFGNRLLSLMQDLRYNGVDSLVLKLTNRGTEIDILQSKTLLDRLGEIDKSLTASHSKIASFLLRSGHKAAFLTAAEIAASVGASESTVVRFARMLGFRGFPELQEFLRAGLLETLSPTDRLRGYDDIKDEAQLIKHIVEKETLNLCTAFEHVDRSALQALTNCICSAKHCYVVGLRSSRSPALLLGHYLMKIAPQVTVIVSSDLMFEQLSWATQQDVLIAYSFPRYSKPTVDAIRIAKSSGARTGTITDSTSSPAAQLSDYSLIAPATSSFFGNSFVAAVAITNLLLAFCARAQPEAVRQNLDRVENAASLGRRFVNLSNGQGQFD